MRTSLATTLGLLALTGWLLRASVASSAREVPDATLLLRVQDHSGKPLAARVRIESRSWTARALSRAIDRTRELERAIDGNAARFSLAEGDYRVFVSHGPEWSLAELELHASPGAQLARSVVLARELSLPGWTASDLHLHTARSVDAARSGVCALDLRAEGIELGVATDHNHIGGLDAEIDSVDGAEITTWQPEIGHFNAFPLQKLPRWRGTDPRSLIRELTRDPQVFVQINHPRLDDHIAYFVLGGFDGTRFWRAHYHLDVHGLEIWNGFDLARPERVHALLREWRHWLALGHRLTATGGSDSHGHAGHLPGYPRTYTRATHAGELASRLRAGQAFVTNGPLLTLDVEGAGPGDTLSWPGDRPLRVRIALSAASWIAPERVELWADETRIWSERVPLREPGKPLAFRTELTLPVGRARVLTAVASGGGGLERLLGRSGVPPLAFTNAVRLQRASRPRAAHAAASSSPR